MVPLCTNYSRKTQGLGISYHRLPRGPLKVGPFGCEMPEERTRASQRIVMSAVVTLNQTVLNRLGKYVATKSQKL